MKKVWLGLLAGLLLLTYQPSLGQAADMGKSNAQISFYSATTTQVEPDQLSVGIPQGTRAYHSSATNTAQPRLVGSLQRVWSTGRLPQTSESAKTYQLIFGGMLLVIALLGWGLHRQIREDEVRREN